MAKFELNIYGENDEIKKTFQTDHVRWGLLLTVLDVQESLTNASTEEQLEAVGAIVKELFVGMTSEDLCCADSYDIFNVFAQVGKLAQKMRGSKNG